MRRKTRIKLWGTTTFNIWVKESVKNCKESDIVFYAYLEAKKCATVS